MGKGRFQQPPSSLLKTYSESVSFDWRLYRQDIRGSITHARALRNAGILTREEFESIEAGLHEIEEEIASGFAGTGDRIEKGGLADIGQPDDTCFEHKAG